MLCCEGLSAGFPFPPLYPCSYALPSGSQVFLYRHRKVRVDEVMPRMPESDLELSGAQLLGAAEEQSARELLGRCAELPFTPTYPLLKVGARLRPGEEGWADSRGCSAASWTGLGARIYRCVSRLRGRLQQDPRWVKRATKRLPHLVIS